MSIKTYSSFYYGYTITSDNYQLDFNEGGSELTAELQVNSYTLNGILSALKSAFETAGANTYTITADRATRKITIASDGTLNLLETSGTHVNNSCWDILGFTADKTGASSYEGDVASGYAYYPQYTLQSYVDQNAYQEKIKATVNESASGTIEIVQIGVGIRKFYEFNIVYITSIYQPSSGPIVNNSTGITDAESFMQEVINKFKVEFMPDKDSPDTYYTLILEKTPESSQGTGYRLKEDFGKLPGYYKTGILKWRVIE